MFFLVDKGEVKDELVRLRQDLIAEHGRPPYRIAEACRGHRRRRPGVPAGRPSTIDLTHI
ncbi:hypothetical protein AB0C27_48085 [Nonomuraea sp. NPDC048882]|uniref:hypothetical protein n=1 Tax=Nonomuraea sp. NPDC048882 TaxID=3154347 RepID=UPI0033D5A092